MRLREDGMTKEGVVDMEKVRHKTEAHQPDGETGWAWRCETCGRESQPNWKTPDDALAEGEAHTWAEQFVIRRPLGGEQR